MPIFPVLRHILIGCTALGLLACGGDGEDAGTVAKLWDSVGWQARRFEIVPE